MTLGQLARLSGSSALVLKNLEVRESGPHYVHIEGRKAGLISWLCSLVGIDSTTVFDVYDDRIEYSDGSLSGSFKETIPLTKISNLGTGYLKPFLFAILAALFLLLAIPTFGVTLLFTALFAFLYWTQKSLLIYFIPHSGSTTAMAFKRSLIEGVSIDAETANKIVSIISDLVEKNTEKQG